VKRPKARDVQKNLVERSRKQDATLDNKRALNLGRRVPRLALTLCSASAEEQHGTKSSALTGRWRFSTIRTVLHT
jgi:hypothetical protein